MRRAGNRHASECAIVSSWLLHSAIPFWAVRGIGEDGLAHEEFTFDGQAKELGYRRSLVQFRQVYVLAHAALGGYGSAELPCALFSRAASSSWHPDGGFMHTLPGPGLRCDATRDTYDQAFGILAAAWTYALDRKQETIDYAYRTLRFLDEQMASPKGGYVEAIPGRLPRRQNPHMHLFEAFLMAYEVTGDPSFLSHADAIYELLERHFTTPQGALREYFSESWSPASGAAGEITEPGHHFEWVWLLHYHARVSKRPLGPLAERLFVFATQHGLDAEGLPLEQVDIHGAPLKRSLKLWAITEQLKAHVVRAELGERDHDPRIESIVAALHTRFLIREPAPLWYEEMASHGEPARHRMPVSTLYHLTLGVMELLRWGQDDRFALRVETAR